MLSGNMMSEEPFSDEDETVFGSSLSFTRKHLNRDYSKLNETDVCDEPNMSWRNGSAEMQETSSGLVEQVDCSENEALLNCSEGSPNLIKTYNKTYNIFTAFVHP